MEVMNFICCKAVYESGDVAPQIEQIGERLMEHIPDALTMSMFTAPVFGELFSVFRRYYDRYQELPTEEPFRPFLHKDKQFQAYLEKAPSQQKDLFNQVMRRLFRPVRNQKFMRDKVEGLLIQIGVKDIFVTLQQGQMNGDSPAQAMKDTVTETIKLDRRIKWVIDQEQEEILDPFDMSVSMDFTQQAGLTTKYPGFYLYRTRPSVLLAPAKIGKTRFAVNVVYELAKLGMDVMYADGENGVMDINMRIKALMIEELDAFRYAPPIEAFYADCFFNPKFSQKNLSTPVHNSKELLRRGDRISRPRYFTIMEYSESGVPKQRWVAELDIFEVTAPQAQLSSLPEEPMDTELFKLDTTLGLDDESWYVDIDRIDLKLQRAGIAQNIKGAIRILHDRDLKPSTLSYKLKELRTDRSTTHFKQPGNTVIVGDWMGKFGVDGGKGMSTWERSREKYRQYGALMEEYQAYMMIIDGVSNPEECQKGNVQVSKIQPKDNKQISYDAAQVHVLVQSEEEKDRRCARLMVKETKGKGQTVYLRSNPNYSKMEVIDWSVYQTLCPETWEEMKSSSPVKGTKGEVSDHLEEMGGDFLDGIDLS